jgi:hypothetical protein
MEEREVSLKDLNGKKKKKEVPLTHRQHPILVDRITPLSFMASTVIDQS